MTFTAALEAMEDSELELLLTRRPDVLAPYHFVQTFDRLASVLSSWTSQSQAMSSLDRFERRVLDLAVLAGERGTNADLVDASGGALDIVDAAAGVDALRSVGLVWVDGEGTWHLPGQIRSQYLHPAGLGRPFERLAKNPDKQTVELMAERLGAPVVSTAKPRNGKNGPPRKGDYVRAVAEALTDLDRVNELLDRCPDPEVAASYREALEAGDPAFWMPPSYAYRYRARDAGPKSAHDWLADRGLVVRVPDGGEIPREVGLAMRGGRPFPDIARVPPAVVEVSAGPPGSVDRASAAAAMRIVEIVTGLLLQAADERIALNKSGDMGVRPVKSLAARLDAEPRDAMRAVELCDEAGLVQTDFGSNRQHLVVSERGRLWLDAPPAEQWLCLVDAWLHTPILVGAAGGRDGAGKNLNAMRRRIYGLRTMPAVRLELLRSLAAVDPERAPDPASLRAHLEFGRPELWAYAVADVTGGGSVLEVTLAEAELLGVTGAGGLSTPLRAHLDGERDELVEAARAHLPEVVDRLVVQADLTILAPGPVSSDLARSVGAMADVESRGGATTWRLSEASVRSALDDGWSKQTLLDVLERHAGGIPQPVRYLLDDVARRHGHLRVRGVGAVVRCDDEALLASAVAHRKLRTMLELVAPTVAVAGDAAADDVMQALRDAGFLPALEGAGGEVLAPTRTGPKPPDPSLSAASTPGWWRTDPDARSGAGASSPAQAVVERLRAPAPEPLSLPDFPARPVRPVNTSVAMDELELANRQRWSVWIATIGEEFDGIVRGLSERAVMLECFYCPDVHVIPFDSIEDYEIEVDA